MSPNPAPGTSVGWTRARPGSPKGRLGGTGGASEDRTRAALTYPLAVIRTARLDLVPASPERIAAALDGSAELAEALDAEIPAGWPPEHVDAAALTHTLEKIHEDPSAAVWWMHFFVLGDASSRVLIGAGGYAGPPDARGVVEIGYSIVDAYQRRGYAVEAAQGLVRAAFEDPRVTRVIAETLPELAGSIAVLRRCGFVAIDGASEAGVVRFGIDRPESTGRDE